MKKPEGKGGWGIEREKSVEEKSLLGGMDVWNQS